MKVLLCSVPDGPVGSPNVSGNFIRPMGIVQLTNWMDKKGLRAEIYDINNLRPTDEELIATFKRSNPTVVGLSATLSHSYPHVKHISKILRQLFPDIWIVVGGHITSSANVILNRTETDICVVGDGEIPFIKLLEYFKLNSTHHQFNYPSLYQIKGLAFNDVNNKLKVTGFGEQLPAPELEYENYARIKELSLTGDTEDLINKYFIPVRNHPDVMKTKFYKSNIDKNIAFIDTAKGCVARCTFCQRATKGYRAYSTNNLEAHILYLKKHYNVAGLSVNDENFGSDRKQAYDVARIMKKCDVFWIASAVRCTSVTYEDLEFYKEHNLIYVRFGIESGSQKMLDIMEKKFSTKDVFDAVSNCVKTGVLTGPDAIMVGMPGETEETIRDSAKFMGLLRYVVGLDWSQSEPPFWAMAIPGTPLYEYCQQIGLIGKKIDEEEEYLIRMAREKASFLNHLNTTELSVQQLHSWNYIYRYEAKAEYLKLLLQNNRSIKDRIMQIYEKCIKGDLENTMMRLKYFRTKFKFKHGLKFYFWSTGFIASALLFSLGIILLPRIVINLMIRTYAKIRYYAFERRFKVRKDKQRYNIFKEVNVNSTKKLKITDDRIAQTDRPIERSLRHITMINRKYMKPLITDEERGLDILAQGQ